ncbi:MAG: ABC transporter ATP-binding protein [Candidatus Sumerlaeaceae bacterium]|nr:ABC transporter ATP-binding protein [Candidatus Sumerlaeaceae bacterium]
MSELAIEAVALRKVYRYYPSPWRRLRSLLGGDASAREFVALDNVTLRVPKGTTLGILGPNGAGKSTLLKILAGIVEQTSGTLVVRGAVGSILELGAGFHPEFSGRENLALNAALLGFPPERTQELIARVEEFCELGAYLDLPVKTYSSGMFVRLAFSAAIAIDPDILLVDEALAVGDAVFAHKCIGRVQRLRERGCTIIFVTHDTATLTQICDRAVLIAQGNIVADGLPREVVDLYLIRVAEQLARNSSDSKAATIHVVGARENTALPEKRFGNFQAEIVECSVEGADGRSLERFPSGTPVRLRMRVLFHRRVENPVFGVMIKNRNGVEVFGTNTHLRAVKSGTYEAGERAETCFDMPVMLGAGTYSISYAVHTADGQFFDYRVDARLVEVLGVDEAIGVVNLPVAVTVSKIHDEETRFVSDLAAHLFPDAPAVLDMTERCDRFLAGEWHAPESDEIGAYRWLAREGLAFLSRGTGSVLEIELETHAPDADTRPIVVALYVNGVSVGELAVSTSCARVHRFELLPEIIRAINTITFSASRVWSPSQFAPASHDSRQLSVLVRRIAML